MESDTERQSEKDSMLYNPSKRKETNALSAIKYKLKEKQKEFTNALHAKSNSLEELIT